MPIFRLADDPSAQERLGNAVNFLPAQVVEGVPRMSAWTSFVFALVANPDRAFVVTDPEESSSLRNWLEEHAPGAVLEG